MTKPVGVCGVAKSNPIILQALAPPPQPKHTLPQGTESSYLGLFNSSLPNLAPPNP